MESDGIQEFITFPLIFGLLLILGVMVVGLITFLVKRNQQPPPADNPVPEIPRSNLE